MNLFARISPFGFRLGLQGAKAKGEILGTGLQEYIK